MNIITHPKYPNDGQWGIFDGKDKLWMGNEDGPVVYGNKFLARAAMTVLSEQTQSTRYRVRHFTGADELVDEVAVKYTPEQAVKRIERRITK